MYEYIILKENNSNKYNSFLFIFIHGNKLYRNVLCVLLSLCVFVNTSFISLNKIKDL